MPDFPSVDTVTGPPSAPDHSSLRRFIKPRRLMAATVLAVIISVAGALGWLSFRAAAALNQISDRPDGSGNFWQFLTQADDVGLRGEAEDRINVLFLGMGGSGHPGGQLTDTAMILSLQPKAGRVALISLPRDLYVSIPGHGWGKLNSAHATGEQTKSGEGPALAKKTVSELLELPIHYYIRIDFKGFEQLVDALGGLDITVEKAIADPYFPDERMVGYEPFYLKAGPTHMDGELALKYARSRETTSDFDRSRRQQQLLAAIKEKALSAGVLLNPKKLADILGILGSHVRADLAAWEMERFLDLVKTFGGSQVITKVYDTANGSPLTSRTDPAAGYIIVPRSGNFRALQDEVADIFDGSMDKNATIAIENASGSAALGGNVALLLRGYGYQVTDVTTAKTRSTSRLLARDPTVFPSLRAFLSDRFEVAVETGATSQTVDFLLVVGQDYAG